MRILLTGPNAFSGRAVLDLFLRRGYDVTTISRSPLKTSKIGDLNCIYTDLSQISELPGEFDSLVHIAATSPAKDVTTQDIIRDNVTATHNLVKLAVKAKIQRCIFFSSLSVYGEINQSEVTENTPIYNPCVYGASKLMCESILREQTSFKTVAIRLPAVIGKGAARHWLANAIDKIKSGQNITIYNPNSLFNNAVHIDSLASFIDSLLHYDLKQSFDFVNIGSDGGLPINAIANKIVSAINPSTKINIGSTIKVPFTISTQYIREKYGFKPLDFAQALDSYLNVVGSEA